MVKLVMGLLYPLSRVLPAEAAGDGVVKQCPWWLASATIRNDGDGKGNS